MKFILGTILLNTLFINSANAQKIEQYAIFEAQFSAPIKNENPFTEITFSGVFTYKNRIQFTEGFYDGNETFKLRFMPDEIGEWTYTTTSNHKDLNNKTGKFTVTPPSKNNHGPVRVRNQFHFGYQDGTPYCPIGTTAYAWVWQGDSLIKLTLATLSKSPFNKLRMTIMPKTYDVYITSEPFCYPFEGDKTKGWDFTRPNPKYWQFFEDKVAKLLELGIEADIILFHPYDYGKWGFDRASKDQNIFYLRYAIARLSAYRNVWWSLANEFDLMYKTNEEWQDYFKTVATYDPVQHLRSIHNGKQWYNYAEPWVTHLSIQTPYLEQIQNWRNTYHKPVLIDECVYEGNVPYDWGNLTAEEMTHRFWITWMRGGYCTHGETYKHPKNILWWAKGGTLYGKSPERIAFMKSIMEQVAPYGLIPHYSEWNKETFLFKDDTYMLYYIGNSQQSGVTLPGKGKSRYKVEIIDTWNMTRTPLKSVFAGGEVVPLNGKPYQAIWAVKVE